MGIINTPRLFIGGTFPGVGKSLLATGLAMALRRRGVGISCCVTGEAVQQAAIFRRLSRRYTRIISKRLLSDQQILDAISQASLGAELVLIDGSGGLYDRGAIGEDCISDAEIAILSGTPVVLLADVPEYSSSISALVKGYAELLPDVPLGGVLGNRLGGFDTDLYNSRSNPNFIQLSDVLRRYALPPFYGGLPPAPFATPLPPNIFSQAENHTTLQMQFLFDIADLTERYVDVDGLIDLANSAPVVEYASTESYPVNSRCRFAVTDDSCFNLCYQDNLDLIRHFGAEMVPFSPLIDRELPRDVGGLYITGAYMSIYGEELANNDLMREAILNFADRGGVLYSEGAGTAYLCRAFQIERGGPQFAGVGLIPAEAVPLNQTPRFFEGSIIEDSVLGNAGDIVKGFSSGEWGLRSNFAGTTGQVVQTLRIAMDGAVPVNEGYSASAQSISTFNFLHFGSQPQMARALVEAAAVAT